MRRSFWTDVWYWGSGVIFGYSLCMIIHANTSDTMTVINAKPRLDNEFYCEPDSVYYSEGIKSITYKSKHYNQYGEHYE
jgi:hypothetical protein